MAVAVGTSVTCWVNMRWSREDYNQRGLCIKRDREEQEPFWVQTLGWGHCSQLRSPLIGSWFITCDTVTGPICHPSPENHTGWPKAASDQ